MRWERFVRERDGIASAADLHALGLTDIDIRLHAMYGRITRIRRGWYSLRDVDPLILHACRLGGRLTCLSLLRLHGEDTVDDGRLHIELRRSDVLRVPAGERYVVRVHWKRSPSPGGRGAVTLAAARRQAIACQPW